ncbi:hypothetical protein [Ammoniphilus sp. CFH 90114]|uniref:hypothetical protein n=1 Tax=Ammoniphilus sp. CFH 90114 TaxID=2493665 RepID=UPI00100DE80F|nr:hypothetical protein [Ammoniphilus sp. CFH 90114]RXT05302.1 hypothetical protein EIZ39_18190 [Ammoniphilus sp. CFH 90114]
MNENIPALSLSPFSMLMKYQIRWGKIETKEKKISLSENEQRVLKRFEVWQYATKNQLAKQLSRNLRRGKVAVDRLRDLGVIVEHGLIHPLTGAKNPIYTLHPNLAKKLGVQNEPTKNIENLLRNILLNQVFVRFSEVDEHVEILPFPSPFDGALTLNKIDYRLGIIRGSMQPIVKHFLYHKEKMRTLLVVEDLNQANELLAIENPFFRVTTDYHLLKTDLSKSFYRSENGDWVSELVPVFKSKERDDRPSRVASSFENYKTS